MKKFKTEYRRVKFDECASSAGQWCLVFTESEDEDARTFFDIIDEQHQKLSKDDAVNVDDLPKEYLDLLKLKSQIVMFVNGDDITADDVQNVTAAFNLLDNDSLVARKPNGVDDPKELDRIIATRVYATAVVKGVQKIDQDFLGQFNSTIIDLRDSTLEDLDKNIITLVQAASQNFVAIYISDEVEALLEKEADVESQAMKFLRGWLDHRKACLFSPNPTNIQVRSLNV